MKSRAFIRLIIFFTSAILLHVNLPAQQQPGREIFWTFGFNIGSLGIAPVKYNSAWGQDFKRTNGFIASQNGRGGTVLAGTRSLGFHTGLLWGKPGKNMASLQFDFQQNRNSYVFDLPFEKKVLKHSSNSNSNNTAHSASDSTLVSTGNWTESDLYLKGSVSFQYLFYLKNYSLLRGDKYAYTKLSFGQTFLHRNQGQVVQLGQADEGTDDQGNITKAKTISVNPKAFMLGAEVGLRSFSIDNDHSLDIGLSWQIPLGVSYTRQYEFAKAVPRQAPQPVGGETIAFTGSSILLNVTYNFNSKLKHCRDTTSLYQNLAQPATLLTHVPHHLNGRHVKLNGKIEAGYSLVTARIWDRGKVDGDIVSLYLNGVEVLHEFTVSKAKKNITLHLKPGKNYLVMHALNLGRIPPNTAAVEIGDGKRNKPILLSSDLYSSGAVEIGYKSNETPQPVKKQDDPYKMPTQPVNATAYGTPRFIAEGRVRCAGSVTVDDSLLTAFVWDYKNEDGDGIALYLNGEPVLEYYEVTTAGRTIDLHLKPGKNYLVMQAINSGKYKPNTAAVTVWCKEQESPEVRLSAFQKYGSLEINYIPRH